MNFSDSESESIFSLRLQFDYAVSEDLLLYASYNRGVKGFGFNAPLDPSGSALFVNPLTFDPAAGADDAFKFDDETLNAFEVGFKSTFADDSVRLNVSAFYYDYSDYQALNMEGITQVITNNDARMYGVDLELYASPTEGMDLIFGAAYLDNEVEDVNVGGVIADREVAYAPSLSLTGLVRQEWTLSSGGAIAAQVNARWLDDHYLGLSNAAVLEEDSYAVANARLSYTLPSGNVTVALFANNLFDEEYRTVAFDLAGFFGSVESQIGRPREYGGSISFRF